MKFTIACILFAFFGMAMSAVRICMINVDLESQFEEIAKTLRTRICNEARSSYTNLATQLNGEVVRAAAAGWDETRLRPLLEALTEAYVTLSTTNRMINEAK